MKFPADVICTCVLFQFDGAWCKSSWDSCISCGLIFGRSKLPILPGLEPGIPWFVVRCLIHWATRPCQVRDFMTGVEGVTRVTLWSPCRRSTPRTSLYSQLTWARTGILSVGIRRSLFKLWKAVRKRFDLARTRTWNPLIRSQMPYPLGHTALTTSRVFSV